MKYVPLFCVIICLLVVNGYSQSKDKARFIERKPGFYENSILKDIRAVEEEQKPEPLKKYMRIDMTGKDLPNKLDGYKSSWHQPPISQGNTGTCWCFSTVSYMESEVMRLNKKEVKLSEMYTVYWEYVEKAREYVRTRGTSAFPQGSEANAVTRMFRMYGTMPWSAYSGLQNGRKHHTHEEMYKEMMSFLKSVKKNNEWNEAVVLETIKAIMNFHIGEPPAKFTYEGKEYTPKAFLADYLKLNMDDYVDILSYSQEPYWKQVEYKVEDNWWHSEEYYNLPLDDFMKILKESLRKGYTLSIGGDVSEAGFDKETQCAVVPTFDIPAEYIDENARQFRFSNRSTTDDHGMHVVGFLEKDGKDWYLVKDSSSGSRNNDEKAKEFGYYFFHEDYVKLKMMDFCVHKDMLKDYIKKFK